MLSNNPSKAITGRQGDRLIRVMAPEEKRVTFRTMTFSENEVQAIASIDDDQTALVLRSGLEIPVQLGYDALEQKIYRPDFRTDDGDVLDLRALTGEAAKPSFARLNPGEKMPDGTLFAGVSPDSGRGLFVSPSQRTPTMSFNDAAIFAPSFDSCGRRDWRLPTQGELQILFNNRAAIGGFEAAASRESWYWGATEQDGKRAQQYFHDGTQTFYDKNDKASVRFVRD